MTRHLRDLIASRRTVLGAVAGLPLLTLNACGQSGSRVGFASVAATNADTISLPPGYRWSTLIAWGDPLFDSAPSAFDPDALTRAEQELRFGQYNDMIALFSDDYAFPPPRDAERMILCANNEAFSLALSFPALRSPEDFTAERIEALYASVGVSVVDLERGPGGWRVVRNSAPGAGHNRRITPFTPVRFTGPAAQHRWIVSTAAIVNAAEPDAGNGTPGDAVRCGTLANCAGGLTPWGTYLSAEENFDSFFAGSDRALAAPRRDAAFALDELSFGYPSSFLNPAAVPSQFRIGENPHGPALYGWIVEIDPHDPNSIPKKRTALGRKKNECATTALARDGRVVVYMGDDQRGEHLYKFVSRGRFDRSNRAANADLLDEGRLYCAEFLENGQGRWLHITADAANAAAERRGSPIRFADEGDIVMRVRDAARLMGATPLDRPEDVEALRNESWRGLGPVLVACTNNNERGVAHPGSPRRESAEPESAQANLPGHILRIDEAGDDCASERFSWNVFAMGGDPNSDELTAVTRGGAHAHISTNVAGAPTIAGDRLACPDNLFIDSSQRIWICTDGSDGVFPDCNDNVLMTTPDGAEPRPMKRFLVAPVGAEICGPIMTPDERAFICAVQHPGANDVAGGEFDQLRWQGARPASSFPDGGDAWPRSAVIIVTRDDGGRIGD